ncbi:MAG: nucleoside triphosphate pyrophosphohydrolase [Alphaproteobacteria bacterium]|nr:nucleoside triphosphate pyrophosphohydrolase [Alphaproteobacteria bacterium]
MSKETDRLIEVMARLRNPDGGCPWDLEQTFDTIAPYTIEEAYEVADAIGQGDRGALKEELGDLLLQVVYHARMAEEEAAFAFEDVARGIADKMVRRHPHVFGDATVADAEAQTASWEAQKAAERAAAGGAQQRTLDGVPLGMPALTRAEKLTRRAARVGFDWPDADQVFDKMAEEIAELRHEIAEGAPRARLEDELGDLLFCVANLARHLKVDPEHALRAANAKFERRFRAVEDSFASEGRGIADASLDAMEERWQRVKMDES